MLIGVNAGPNLTYTGSLATLLWRGVLRERDAEPSHAEFHRLGALTVPPILIGATVALWARDMKVLAWITEGGWEACVDAAAAFGAADVTLLHVTALDVPARAGAATRRSWRAWTRSRARPRRRCSTTPRSGSGAARRLALTGVAETIVLAEAEQSHVVVVTRDGRHVGPHSLGHAERFVVDHAPCTVVLAWPDGAPEPGHHPTEAETQAQTEAEAASQMTLPPGPRGPHLLQAAGWITRPGPYSRRLRERYGDTFTLHVERHASVGDRLAPRRRQAGLHRRPERAARGRGQRDPQAAARRALACCCSTAPST